MASDPYILDDLSRLVGGLSDGDLNRDGSELLNDVVGKLERHAENYGTAAGTITLKLGFEVNSKGQVRVGFALDSKTPKPKTGSSAYYVTDDGKLSVKNPRQRELPLDDLKARRALDQ
ncbi:MAG: hypothetical protein IV100_17675 [Myxococcales bacterium]|nr:hypothetical protein [Myxococcales bacterium]